MVQPTMSDQPETDSNIDSDSADDQEQSSDAVPVLPLAAAWPEGEVWFRDYLPTETAWGTEELLDPVPDEQRGLWAVQLGATALIGERRHRSGAVVPVENAEAITRLITDGTKITAMVVPWFERLIPATLVTPLRKSITRPAENPASINAFSSSMAALTSRSSGSVGGVVATKKDTPAARVCWRD